MWFIAAQEDVPQGLPNEQVKEIMFLLCIVMIM